MPPTNSVPYEIVGMPADVYIGAVGVAFPDIDATPNPANWTKLGTNGSLNYTPDGVKAGQPQSFNVWRSLGSAAPRKVFRTEEDGKYGVSVADMTLETLTEAIGSVTPTLVAAGGGTAAHKKIGLSRGLNIPTVALFIRVQGGSPYMADGNLQYEIPRAQYTGSPEVVWRRDNPGVIDMEWMALVDPNAASDEEQLGRIVAQTGASAS